MNEDAVPHLARAALKHAVSEGEHTSCGTTKAWTLRHGLDRAYMVLAAHTAMRGDSVN